MKNHLSISIASILALSAPGIAKAQSPFTITAAIGGVPTVSGATLENFDEPNPSILTLSGFAYLLTGANYSVAYVPPYFSGSTAAFFGESPTIGLDTTPYVVVEIGGSATLSFPTPQTYLGLLWGSIDTNDYLTFYDSSNNVIGTVSGMNVPGAVFNGQVGLTNTSYVNITSATAFSRVVATAGVNSFEFDDVAYAQVACDPAPSGLVGWWPGEGNANDVVAGNNGTLQNVGFTNGVVGQAFVFYGYYGSPHSQISIPDQPVFELTNSLSIEGWINPAGAGGYPYGGIIFWRGDCRPGYDPYELTINGDNTLGFVIADASNNVVAVNTPTPLANNQWYHVAATLDGNTGTMSIYVNGVLAAQTNTSMRPFGPLIPSLEPTIGIGNVGTPCWDDGTFNGDIDEIALYSRALSQSEIQAIYNAGSSGKCPLSSLQITPATGFPACGPVGGPFTVTNETFTLTGIGTNSLNWSLSNTSSWLYASPTGGTLTVGGTTNVTVSLNSNAYYLPLGVYTATVWFTNLSDNVVQSRQFTLTVIGPPVITCPSNITVTGCSNGAVVNYAVTVSGGCPPITTNCVPPSGSTFPSGTTTVNCSATDSCGQSNNCSFTVTVSPPPLSITCPSNITVTGCSNGAVVNYAVTVSGGCPPITTNCVPPSGSTFPSGITTVNCSATDSCGQSNNCSFTVTVSPPPLSITCPGNITVTGCSNGAVVNYAVTVSGGCPPITTNCVPPSGSTFPSGTTTVNCSATDSCGQSNNCSFTVDVFNPYNVLVNPGAEAGDLTGWTELAPVGYIFVTGTNMLIPGGNAPGYGTNLLAHSGSNTFQMFNTTGDSVEIYQDFPAVAGTLWQASVWAISYASNYIPAGASAHMEVVFYDVSNNIVPYTNPSTSFGVLGTDFIDPSDYTGFGITWTVIPPPAVDASGWIYLQPTNLYKAAMATENDYDSTGYPITLTAPTNTAYVRYLLEYTNTSTCCGDVYFDDCALTKLNQSDPDITNNPVAVTTYAGNAAGFSVTGVKATKAEVLTYQWQLNGTNLPPNGGVGHISGNTTGNALSISNCQPVDAGLYSVVVSDSPSAGVTNSIRSVPVALTVLLLSPFDKANVLGPNAGFETWALSGWTPWSPFNGCYVQSTNNFYADGITPVNVYDGNYCVVVGDNGDRDNGFHHPIPATSGTIWKAGGRCYIPSTNGNDYIGGNTCRLQCWFCDSTEHTVPGTLTFESAKIYGLAYTDADMQYIPIDTNNPSPPAGVPTYHVQMPRDQWFSVQVTNIVNTAGITLTDDLPVNTWPNGYFVVPTNPAIALIEYQVYQYLPGGPGISDLDPNGNPLYPGGYTGVGADVVYWDDMYLIQVVPVTNLTTSVSGTNFNLSFNAGAGLNYAIQYKTNLTDATWVVLSNNVAAPWSWQTNVNSVGTSYPVTVSDPVAAQSRFYRVQAQ